MEAHYYQVDITWSKDRKGVMSSPEVTGGTLKNGCIEVATPPEFPKGIAGLWSPEHLYTGAVASCLMTTFLAIAGNSKLEFTSFACTAKGKLEQVEGKFLMTEVMLEPTLTIVHEEEREKALRVLEKSEKACLISNSIKALIRMSPMVVVADLVH